MRDDIWDGVWDGRQIMRTGQSSRKSWQSMAFILAALVVAGLATVYSTGTHGSLGWGIKHPPASQMQIASSGAEDLRLLWQWTDGELQGGASAAVWNLRWSVKGLQESQALSLAKALGLQTPRAGGSHRPIRMKKEARRVSYGKRMPGIR